MASHASKIILATNDVDLYMCNIKLEKKNNFYIKIKINMTSKNIINFQ